MTLVVQVAYSFPRSLAGTQEVVVVEETLTGAVDLGVGPLSLLILAAPGPVSAAHCTATCASSVTAGATGACCIYPSMLMQSSPSDCQLDLMCKVSYV